MPRGLLTLWAGLHIYIYIYIYIYIIFCGRYFVDAQVMKHKSKAGSQELRDYYLVRFPVRLAYTHTHKHTHEDTYRDT